MAMTSKIRVLMAEKGIKQKDLARMLGTTEATLSRKLDKDDWKESELKAIAAALGCKYNLGSFE